MFAIIIYMYIAASDKAGRPLRAVTLSDLLQLGTEEFWAYLLDK